MTRTRPLTPTTMDRLRRDQMRQADRHSRRIGSFPKSRGRRGPLSASAVFAIAIVVSLGAAAALPMPAAAQTSASLSGQVVDPDGVPIGAVDVTATKHSGVGDVAQVQETTSDENGSYAFTSLSSGTWNITFRADGYGKTSKGLELAAGDDETLNVTLAPSWAQTSDVMLAIQVVDDATGDAISGVEVTVTGYFSQGPTKRSTTTDAEGRASIALYEGENQVHLARKGYRTHDFWTTPEREAESDRAPIRLFSVPEQTVTITGTVTDAATGGPVQAYIQLRPDRDRMEDEKRSGSTSGSSGGTEPAPDRAAVYPGSHPGHDNWNSTTTATDGTFTIHAYPGHVVLTANRVDFIVHEARLTLADGETRTVDPTLKKMPAKSVTLSGTVTDAKTGEPVRGAAVSIQVPEWSDHAWVQTDSEGQYSAKVRPGFTLVEVAHHGHWYGDDVVVMESRAGPADDDGTSTASSDGASDPGEGGDAPNESAAIAPAPPGEGPQYYTKSETIRTAAGENRTLDVALPPKPEPQTELVGYVVDTENQTGIAAAQVNFYNQETGDWGHATTDADGSYRFMVRGGYSTLRVWVDGYLPAVVDVTLPDDGRVRQDLRVQPGDHAQAGWWDPDGRDCCYAYEESADSASGTSMAVSDGGGDASKEAARSQFESSGAAASGSRSGAEVEGEGGGLGPYDPDAAPADGFDSDVARDAPAPALLVAVLAIGLVAVVVGMRTRRG